MIKRTIDFIGALFGLMVSAPILVICAILIRRYDGGSPLYIAQRVGKGNHPFLMYKLRSMVINADKSGVSSTSNSDARITPVGQFVRKFKLDEFMQLLNVLKGDMSLVGPRPNVASDVKLYTSEELHLLSVPPGITDFSSIVFSDEGKILEGHSDPDLAYNQIIRPWKSRLGLFYIKNQNTLLDLKLIYLTVLSIVSRPQALEAVSRLLDSLNAPPELISVARRDEPLKPFPPPGASEVVTSRAAND